MALQSKYPTAPDFLQNQEHLEAAQAEVDRLRAVWKTELPEKLKIVVDKAEEFQEVCKDADTTFILAFDVPGFCRMRFEKLIGNGTDAFSFKGRVEADANAKNLYSAILHFLNKSGFDVLAVRGEETIVLSQKI